LTKITEFGWGIFLNFFPAPTTALPKFFQLIFGELLKFGGVGQGVGTGDIQ